MIKKENKRGCGAVFVNLTPDDENLVLDYAEKKRMPASGVMRSLTLQAIEKENLESKKNDC